MSTHTISLVVENHSGALSRIAGLFSSRGYNIASLTVAETEDPSVSRMTIVVSGDESIIEQVVKQLNRLIDVIKVIDFQEDGFIDRETILIRINATKTTRLEIATLVNMYAATIVAVSPSSMTMAYTGASATVEDFIDLIRPFGIKELVKTGKIAIGKAKN
jgi:acetolactate synthase-1/3 small subunit